MMNNWISEHALHLIRTRKELIISQLSYATTKTDKYRNVFDTDNKYEAAFHAEYQQDIRRLTSELDWLILLEDELEKCCLEEVEESKEADEDIRSKRGDIY